MDIQLANFMFLIYFIGLNEENGVTPIWIMSAACQRVQSLEEEKQLLASIVVISAELYSNESHSAGWKLFLPPIFLGLSMHHKSL